jgi:hypothetical protein
LNGPGAKGIVGSHPTSMICTFCSESNPDTNRFCGKCGTALDAVSERLRQQIVTIIGQEFKDQDMVAALVAEKVADKVEKRIWLFTKILGIAGGILGAVLAVVGVTSVNDVRNKINNASQVATKASEDAVAAVNKASQNAVTASQGAIATVNTVSQNAEAQMLRQARSITSKAQASGLELEEDETEIEGLRADYEDARGKLEAFKQAFKQTPDKPIGQFDKRLFIDTPSSGPKIYPYYQGQTRPGVKTIQIRLAELGCYQGQPSGTFTPETASAVIAFVNANTSVRLNSSDIPTSTEETPSPTILHAVPGEVDYHRWRQMFARGAAKCPQ